MKHYQEWRDQINPDKKLRTYLHIDDLLDLNNEKFFQKIVRVFEDIKNHQFLPFIKRGEISLIYTYEKY